MMFSSKNLQSIANKDTQWETFEMPAVDAAQPLEKRRKAEFVSLQMLKENKEDFIPLCGERQKMKAGWREEDETTFEEKLIRSEKEAYEKGFAQGEKDGYELGERKAKKIIINIEKLLDEIAHSKAELVKKYEKEILETIFTIAEKIIHAHAKFDETAVRSTILAALKLTSEKRDVTLKINPEDFEYVEKLRPELFSEYMNVKSIMITSDPKITRGGCVLETESGDIDASIETQLDMLRQSMKEAYKR